MVQTVTYILAALVVLGQIGVIVTLISLLLPEEGASGKLVRFVGTHSYRIAWIVALVSTLGSLFYSEIAGYNPCKLCWIQRIFMYPQLILIGMAMRIKDKAVVLYSLTLSAIGATIALYHYLLQLGVVPALSCSAVGVSESCSARFVMTYGYITIPMMALTGFLMIITSWLCYRKIHNA